MSSPRVVRRALGFALFGIAAYYALIGGEYTVLDLLRLHRAQEREAAQLASVRAARDSLETLVEELENDRATIEAVARERFGMIKEGEVLYRIVEVDSVEDGGQPQP